MAKNLKILVIIQKESYLSLFKLCHKSLSLTIFFDFTEFFSKILWFLAHWPTQFRSLKSSYSSAYSVLTSVTAKTSVARNGNFQKYAFVIQKPNVTKIETLGFVKMYRITLWFSKMEDHINCALNLHDQIFLAHICRNNQNCHLLYFGF